VHQREVLIAGSPDTRDRRIRLIGLIALKLATHR